MTVLSCKRTRRLWKVVPTAVAAQGREHQLASVKPLCCMMSRLAMHDAMASSIMLVALILVLLMFDSEIDHRVTARSLQTDLPASLYDRIVRPPITI